MGLHALVAAMNVICILAEATPKPIFTVRLSNVLLACVVARKQVDFLTTLQLKRHDGQMRSIPEILRRNSR